MLAGIGVLFALTARADRPARIPGSVQQLVDAATPRDDSPLPILDQPCDDVRIRGSADLAQDVFRDALLVLCRYGPDGAAGVRIDRATDAPASAVYTLPGDLLLGGPLGTTRAVLLYRDPEGGLRWTTSHRKARELARNTTLRGLVGIGPAPEDAPLVIAGHASWGPGQLEAEIAAGAWTLLEADTSRSESKAR